MGTGNSRVNQRLTDETIPPKPDQIELTLTGPGYGECIVFHIGNCNWVIIDSCLDKKKIPVALSYLRSLGVDPAKNVRLIVATHWHDDHIRGMGKLVETCSEANFCCSAALCEKEFLAMIGAVENRPMLTTSSGMQELYQVFSLLHEKSAKPIHALANRRIFNQYDCEIWSLSPSDSEFKLFLQKVGQLIPSVGETKRHIPTLTPKQAAVVLLFIINKTAVLLGSDMERSGWLQILEADERPNCEASVFKIPHHGSKNAHVDRVWRELLKKEPIALLTPWRLGGRELPTEEDASRILSLTSKAYITTSSRNSVRKSNKMRVRAVEKTIKETGATLRSVYLSPGKIRLRKTEASQSEWKIETFGKACDLKDFYR